MRYKSIEDFAPGIFMLWNRHNILGFIENMVLKEDIKQIFEFIQLEDFDFAKILEKIPPFKDVINILFEFISFDIYEIIKGMKL